MKRPWSILKFSDTFSCKKLHKSRRTSLGIVGVCKQNRTWDLQILNKFANGSTMIFGGLFNIYIYTFNSIVIEINE
jgi:hypothetical protein